MARCAAREFSRSVGNLSELPSQRCAKIPAISRDLPLAPMADTRLPVLPPRFLTWCSHVVCRTHHHPTTATHATMGPPACAPAGRADRRPGIESMLLSRPELSPPTDLAHLLVSHGAYCQMQVWHDAIRRTSLPLSRHA